MAKDPHFLGVAGGETGLAFLTPGWEPQQPCYLRQGMLDCHSAYDWTEAEKRENIDSFR